MDNNTDMHMLYVVFFSLIVIFQVLTSALRAFEGSILVISHDRTFLEELEPTHVITGEGWLAPFITQLCSRVNSFIIYIFSIRSFLF
jgi:hypothetical protein